MNGDGLKYYRSHILVLVALAIVLSSGLHGAFRNALTDMRFAWDQRQASGEVVVIAIDAPSIEKIGVWPWPRNLHAELLDRLEAAGVKDVAFDVDFSTPSDAASDQAFAAALEKAGGSVVLPSFRQPDTSGRGAATDHINLPLKQFVDRSWSALVNVTVESDGRVRRYPYGGELEGKFVPSMGAVLAGKYNLKHTSFLIDFGIQASSIPVMSYVDVLHGDRATLDRLKDKKVIVGGTALELGDRFSIPNGRVIAGPLLQALATESILQNRTLYETSDVVTVAGICLISLLMMWAWRRLTAGVRVVMLAGAALAFEIAAMLLQAERSLVLDTSLFHVAIAVYMAALALDELDFRGLLGRIAENRFQRIAMSLGDGLICADRNNLITVWNPGAAAIFGFGSAEMIGQPFDTIYADRRDGRLGLIFQDARVRSQPPGGLVIEFDGRRRNGEVFPVEACFSGWQGTDGFQIGAVLRDISVRKREAERIRYLAEHDALTGLVNRSTFQAHVAAMMSAAEPDSQAVVLLVLGIDGFQQINDMLGHTFGDLVLQAVTERLNSEVGSAGLVARLSGDEFAIAAPCAGSKENVARLAERLVRSFDVSLLAGSRRQRVNVSIGAAVHPEGGRTPDELLANGHLAFCRAKATKRGSYVIFESAIRDELEARLTLEAELGLAIERDEFELFYQPQVHLLNGDLIGAEALIRWRHPVRGLVPPGAFMPVVNTSAISDRVAAWVLETACAQARIWQQNGHDVRIGVNLAPSQLQSGDLAGSVVEVLNRTGLRPGLLELEVTEDILLIDETMVLASFRRIQELGVRIVFDDFGTGYASLSYLKKFPLDGLKIDRSFVLDVLTDASDAAIVGSTVGLSRQLGLSVIAEGIENRATADFLLTMGCEEGQGYFFGRPMPALEFESKFFAIRKPNMSSHCENAA